MTNWSLQNAKAKFSELVSLCLEEGPQAVTRHGRLAVVIISALDYEKLSRPQSRLKDFLLSAPRLDLALSRSRDSIREVDL